MPISLFTDSITGDLRAAARGDAKAFERYYAAMVAQVIGFARRRLQNHDLAQEIAAQTFLRIVESLASFDDQRGNARAWTYQICRRLIIDHLRKQSTRAHLQTPVAGADALAQQSSQPDWIEALPDAYLDRKQGSERMAAAWQALTSEDRELLLFRLADDLSYREIASLVGASAPVLRKRVSRAVAALQTHFDATASASLPSPALEGKSYAITDYTGASSVAIAPAAKKR